MSGNPAISLPKLGTAEIVIIVGLSSWTMNWAAYQATGIPFLYCQTRAAFGPLLAHLFDGVRAVMFVWVLLSICTGKLKALQTPLSIMAFTLMVPGFVEVLFGLGAPCSPVMPVFAGWAESIWRGITAPFASAWAILRSAWPW